MENVIPTTQLGRPKREPGGLRGGKRENLWGLQWEKKKSKVKSRRATE